MGHSTVHQKLLLGIYLNSYSNSVSLFKTLYFIAISTDVEYEIVFLLDRIDPKLETEITTLFKYPFVLDFNLKGRAVFFNELIKKEADFYCFIECGMLISPHCLDYMLSVLKENNEIGLIGPSTNNCWNQQTLFNDQYPDKVNFQERFRIVDKFNKSENIELNSLVESFFILKKEVVEKVGFVDENYADGYCWEIDYAIRVKKMGFKIVWSKSVYIHQTLLSEEKERNLTFKKNIKLFHNKFCSKQKVEMNEIFCKNCVGFSCKHFGNGAIEDFCINKKTLNELRQKIISPIVSCIMPTASRAMYVEQSIKYFKNQDYKNLELIIVYDKASDLPSDLENEKNIKLIQVDESSTIGYKRNIACEQANGKIIVLWDDDDWYSSDRISKQIMPIIENRCEITALYNTLFYALNNNEFWESSENLYNKMFVKGVSGGTLAFKKDCWNYKSRFPNTSLREDADFLLLMIENGGRLEKVDGRELYIYLRHNNNSWVFEAGNFIEPDDWRNIDIPDFVKPNLDFYLSIYNSKQPKLSLNTNNSDIKVSCIMPTADRREFVRNAINSFLNQSYKTKELIIIDDGNDKVLDLIPEFNSSIKYIDLNHKKTIGSKRNLACKYATGEVIMHWDDDDRIDPSWISTQLMVLKNENADVTGLNEPHFYNPDTNEAWKYVYPENQKPWVHGGTLCYTKKLWERNPFPDLDIGEDAHFLWSICPKKIVPHNNCDLYLGIIHDKNTSPKITSDSRWHSIKPETILKSM